MRREFKLLNCADGRKIADLNAYFSAQIVEAFININPRTQVLVIDAVDDDEKILATVTATIKTVIPEAEIAEQPALPRYRKILYLKNLDCGHCASLIEERVRHILNCEFVSVDMVTTRFVIETTDKKTADNIENLLRPILKPIDRKIQITRELARTTEKGVSKFQSAGKQLLFALGMLIFVITFGVELWLVRGKGMDLTSGSARWWLFAAFLLSYLVLGFDVIWGAVTNLFRGRIFDEKFLMTLATVIAFIIGSYEEAIAVMAFYKLGELLQDISLTYTKHSISKVLDIAPASANLIQNDELIQVKPEEVLPGDLILVKAGERVPVDGIIVAGEASLDTSTLTGEAKYSEALHGAEIYSGVIVVDGLVRVRVVKPYEDSIVSHIFKLVEEANERKAKSETYLTRFAKFYTPLIVAAALVIALWPLFTGNAAWEYFQRSLYNAAIFLVGSCPCALLISVPLTFYAGIGGASRAGVLIKGSNYLEMLGKVDTIAFDKTGTLTKGKFVIDRLVPEAGVTPEQLLERAAYAEATSTHPIAQSIISAYGAEAINPHRMKSHPKSTKFGLMIYLDEQEVAVGNDRFMEKLGIKFTKVASPGVVIYVAEAGKYLGHIVIVDELRAEAQALIGRLHKWKIATMMVTGDTEASAGAVAQKLGIKTYYAQMSPAEKVKKIKQISTDKKHNIAFVGDGINDAPVLAAADVGLSMGGLGSDAAIESSDIILMNDDLDKITTALEFSRKTRRIITENLALIFAMKALVLILAAFGRTFLWLAVFADVGVALIAIFNSLRALRIRKKQHQ